MEEQQNYRVGLKLFLGILFTNLVIIASTLVFWRRDLGFVVLLCVFLTVIDVLAISLTFVTDDRRRML